MRVLLLVVIVGVASCKGGSKQEPAPTPPPQPPAAGCTSDSDCVISCATKGDCCPDPYCERVQSKTAHAEATQANAGCTKADVDKCPSVGARIAVDWRIVPRCKAGACDAEKVPNAPAGGSGIAGLSLPVMIDFKSYDLSCKTAEDCVHVKGAPCDPCDCSRIPIAKRELPRYEAAAKAITCKPVGYGCGKCNERPGPECVDGRCQ
jgi:hypothetical protein